MEVISLACTFAALVLSVASAPTYPESEQAHRQFAEDFRYLREPRSNYLPQYISPCGGGASSLHIPPYGGGVPYNFNRYPGPQIGVGFGGAGYRAAEEPIMEPEMLAFSDGDQLQQGQTLPDHHALARYGGGIPYGGGIGGGIGGFGPSVGGYGVHSGLAVHGPLLSTATGSAYGVFPNANVGGCNIPLLLSCSPSISSGQLVSSGGYGYGSGNSYRLAEEPVHHDAAGQQVHSEEPVDPHSKPVLKVSQVQQVKA